MSDLSIAEWQQQEARGARVDEGSIDTGLREERRAVSRGTVGAASEGTVGTEGSADGVN